MPGRRLVGGNITNSGQNFEILTGPIRTNGSNAAIVRSGVQTCNLTASTGKCDPSITPDYRSNIKVPTLSGVSWGGALSVCLFYCTYIITHCGAQYEVVIHRVPLTCGTPGLCELR